MSSDQNSTSPDANPISEIDRQTREILRDTPMVEVPQGARERFVQALAACIGCDGGVRSPLNNRPLKPE